MPPHNDFLSRTHRTRRVRDHHRAAQPRLFGVRYDLGFLCHAFTAAMHTPPSVLRPYWSGRASRLSLLALSERQST